MDIAIRVRGVGKTFRIFDRPVDRLKEAFSPFRRKYHTPHRALYDINFDIRRGEFVGFVGKNGAGKSTLLKLLSGEMTPTEGHIEIFGSIALLQLGVGFDPELSGIENAKFAGTLMNFDEERIQRMLHEVTEFSELGDFMHHPVKTYSSGMYSRLGFAIAVNVDPDILIADEVLAVGDIRFSQKCLRKMREFKESGKTVILVTHDTSTISVFCDRAIWIKDGTIFQNADSHSVAEDFNNFMLYDRLPAPKEAKSEIETSPALPEEPAKPSDPWLDFSTIRNAIGGEKVRINRAALMHEETGEAATTIRGDARLRLELEIEALEDAEQPYVGWLMNDVKGLIAINLNTHLTDSKIPAMKKGDRSLVTFRFRVPNLNNGHYIFAMSVGLGTTLDHRVHDIFPVRIANPALEHEQLGYTRITEFQGTCQPVPFQKDRQAPLPETLA